ncbi:MAG: KpsF/GutQ family sugar-phosphate isomerase [Planctomycetes bacterium]|nr:KpsF/GutQ family sugar-phosphate isomerase [Planctomycetota bacterium]
MADSPTGDLLDHGREVIRQEARALLWLTDHLDHRFETVVKMVLACQGQVVLTGMGKAGLVAQKVSATLASTGTPSAFLHPAEAFHGDLGRVRPNDLLMVLSNSGETDEIKRLINPVKRLGVAIVAITSNGRSTLAEHADAVLEIGHTYEACPIGLAPTSSTTAMLAMGDAVAMTVARARNFSREDFAFFHPAGALGRQLLRVHEIMRKGLHHTVVDEDLLCCQALERINSTPGRPGAAAVVDAAGVLVGIITDGDIVRQLSAGNRDFLDRPVKELMTRGPKVVHVDQLAAEAYHILQDKKVDQLPVVDDAGRPVGLVDVQDLLDMGKA